MIRRVFERGPALRTVAHLHVAADEATGNGTDYAARSTGRHTGSVEGDRPGTAARWIHGRRISASGIGPLSTVNSGSVGIWRVDDDMGLP